LDCRRGARGLVPHGATAVSLRISALILTLAIMIAVFTVIIAVQFLRPRLVRGRAAAPAPLPSAAATDPLGRRLVAPQTWSALEGELVVTEDANGRRVVGFGRGAP
jgi:hypothetical protein